MAKLNGQEYQGGGWVRWFLGDPECEVRTHVDDVGGRYVIDELHVSTSEGAVTANLLRGLPLSSIEATLNRRLGQFMRLTDRAGVPPVSAETTEALVADYLEREKSEQPLRRPDRVAGDAFYQEVARQYELRAMRSRKPAALLAEEAEVPVSTVHRWIAEARRRDHLRPARKGTSG